MLDRVYYPLLINHALNEVIFLKDKEKKHNQKTNLC
jgi:hypothetical protein